MNTPTFSLAALQARIASTRIAPVQPVVMGLASIVRRDAAKNPRSLQSIIDESGELESHSFEPIDNAHSIAVAE